MNSNPPTDDFPVFTTQTSQFVVDTQEAGSEPATSQSRVPTTSLPPSAPVLTAAYAPLPGPSTQPPQMLSVQIADTPEVKNLRKNLGLTLDEFAQLLGSSARSVSGWENGQAMSQLAERVFREVKALIGRLSALSDPARFPDWLKKQNPAFSGLSPIQLIQSGQMYRLWELVFRIESGNPL
jgi:transcriptional regulator with XRE-family HTH domain